MEIYYQSPQEVLSIEMIVETTKFHKMVEIPCNGVSGIVGFTGDQVTFNIPQHISTTSEQFDIEEFSDVPLVPNAHGSGFMNQLPESLIQNKDTLTHNVSMINLTTYHRCLSDYLEYPTGKGHGSDFDTTPIRL